MRELALQIISLYEKIDEQTQDIKERRQALKELQEHKDDLTRKLLLAIYEAKA